MFGEREEYGQNKQGGENLVGKNDEISFLPKTADEWLEKLGFGTWPIKLKEENSLNLTPEDVGTGTLEDIIKALAEYAPIDFDCLDEVLQEVEQVEKKVHFYASKILNVQDHDGKSGKEGEAMSVTPALVSKYWNSEVSNVLQSGKKSKVKETLNCKAKTIENTSYYGFIPNKLTPLPGNIESLQHLNKVTVIQNFQQPFKNVWKRLILSEASVAVFQDAFWWIFCHLFEPKEPKDMIFSRIAHSFVALFFDIPLKHKDKFFFHYPNCLSQALYSGFCEAFPDSYEVFGKDFKSTLINIIYEWISGVRPIPMLCESWHLDKLEPAGLQKTEEPRKSLAPCTLSFDIEAVLNLGRISSSFSKCRSPPQVVHDKKSHPAGRGPDFQRVQFDILGNSPLVWHFLYVKGIKDVNVDRLRTVVGRTEIAQLPEPRPTYQEILTQCKKNSLLLRQQYNTVLQLSAEESRRIQKQKREVIAKIDKMQNELAKTHSDFKLFSEKIYSLVSHSDYTA